MTHRLVLPTRRNHTTQKVRIAGRRTLYLSVSDDLLDGALFGRTEMR